MSEAIKEFRGKYNFLSNFYSSPITLGTATYPTVEHAYQAHKNGELSWRKTCQSSRNTAAEVKRASYRVKLVPNWDVIKFSIMEQALIAKFTSAPFKQLLIDTGDALIQEGNTWGDTEWGVDLKSGEGKNILGRMLMGIRDDLQQGIKPKRRWILSNEKETDPQVTQSVGE